MNNLQIGKKIKTLRKTKKITQKELGKLLGYSEAHISYIESGNRTISFKDLNKITKIFNIPHEHFADTKTSMMHFRGSLDNNNNNNNFVDNIIEDFKKFAKKQ